MILLYESALPLSRLLGVVGVLAAVIVLIDAVAVLTGSWYNIVTSPWSFYGVTFESVLFAFCHCFYFLVLYEYLVDDGRMLRSFDRRFLNIVAIIIVLLVSAFYLFSIWVVSFAFAWILVLLLFVMLLIMILGQSGHPLALLSKVLMFSLLLWPLSLTFELVSLVGDVRIFAFTSEYIYTLSLFGQAVPVEELFLLLLWPALLALMYESFVDDAS